MLSIVACKQEKKQTPATTKAVEVIETTNSYPEEINAVFTAHGGIDVWNTMRSLSYDIEKTTGIEKQTIDLKSRNDLVETATYRIGFDGNESWVLENEEGAFKGNARFYHNLMFYFYAMPFVLGDEGIHFEATTPLVFEGISYPGFKVSYEGNIGDSPNDNYFMYYDAQSKQMQWLGYTVTFGKDEASEKISYIRYTDWANFNGLTLPNSLTWYTVEEGEITVARNTYNFSNIKISAEKVDGSIFEKPMKAVVPEQ